MAGKWRSLGLLMLAEIAAMSLWFMSAAILPDLTREFPISDFAQAALSSAVQIGFVFGAVASAFLGLADRIDPRRFFAFSAITAALFNASLLVVEPGGLASILARFATGVLLAGVYPVGMKIAVGWGQKDRGFLVGTLVGALTFGSAAPHLLALLGGTDWRWSLSVASLASAAGGVLCLFAGLGPFHAKAPRMKMKAIFTAWTNPKIRYAYAGYLGHMWELYAMWVWVPAFVTASLAIAPGPAETPPWMRHALSFIAIGAGALGCLWGGWLADRAGRERTVIIALVASGACSLLVGLTFGASPVLLATVLATWGFFVVADSAQFSTLVTEVAPAHAVGTALTLQTSVGFLLTMGTIQGIPPLQATVGWEWAFCALAPGPIFGVICMRRLRALRCAP